LPDFYKYLADGNTKPKALRKAKLDFIKSSDNITGNPFFWAGFEYYGNDNKISVQNKKVPAIMMIGIICFGFILMVLIMKRLKLYKQ